MIDFKLLGHDVGVDAYPSIVLPVGERSDGTRVIIYHSESKISVDDIPADSEFVHYDSVLLKEVDGFDPEHFRLFAYALDRVEPIPIQYEGEFFQQFLERPEYKNLDPLIRLAYAKRTANVATVIREIGRCLPLLSQTPKFLQSWCDNEASKLIESLTSPTPDQNPPTRGTVLIVEDNDVWSSNQRRHFEMRGFSTRTALNGISGLAMALELRPTLVILDLRLPFMDGYEFLRRFRSISQLSGIPVLIMSAHTDEWEGRRSEFDDLEVIEGALYLEEFGSFEKRLESIRTTGRSVYLSKKSNFELLDKHVETLAAVC